MKEREREKLVQKRVSTDARITVELDSSKSKKIRLPGLYLLS
jgi:hypothetical protein